MISSYGVKYEVRLFLSIIFLLLLAILMSMNDTPLIRLDHVNLPARKPEWLAEWYAEQFGFKAEGGFVVGPGTLLVFEKGEPPDYRGNIHFGFRCSSRDQVTSWADKFAAALETEEHYCGFKTKDPEGNVFEVYWEQN